MAAGHARLALFSSPTQGSQVAQWGWLYRICHKEHEETLSVERLTHHSATGQILAEGGAGHTAVD